MCVSCNKRNLKLIKACVIVIMLLPSQAVTKLQVMLACMDRTEEGIKVLCPLYMFMCCCGLNFCFYTCGYSAICDCVSSGSVKDVV
jgi:hypothetical protein